MRIAVIILALCLTMILGVQSCTITLGGSILDNQADADAGRMGLVLAFIFVLGAALTWGFPRSSGTLFVAGGAVAMLVGLSGTFHDLAVWGGGSIILGIMAFAGSRELKRRELPLPPVYMPPPRPAEIMLARQVTSIDTYPTLPTPTAEIPFYQPSSSKRWIIFAALVFVILVGTTFGMIATGFIRLDALSGSATDARPVASASKPEGQEVADRIGDAPAASNRLEENNGSSTTAAANPATDASGATSSLADFAAGAQSASGDARASKIIPAAFRGRWDDDLSDGCDGREAALTVTAQGDAVYAYEVESTVMKVDVHSFSAADVSVTGLDEEGKRYSDVYKLRLAANGRALTVNNDSVLKRCPR